MSELKREACRTVLLSAGTSWYLWNFRRKVISELTSQGVQVVVAAPKDEYSEGLSTLPGVRWADWPLVMDGVSPVQELSSLLRFVRIVRQTRPDFVINHGIKANVYGGLACRQLSIPYANSVTGLGMVLTKRGIAARIVGWLYAFASNGARVLFIQNFDDLSELQAAGLRQDVPVVRTFGSGVDLADFRCKPMQRGKGRAFLFVGRLQEDKGIRDFVEAARVVRSRYPESRFIAVGSSTFTNRSGVSAQTLDGWKQEGIVEFIGQVDDIRSWLERVHALVLPSRREGMPRVILEAAATGRPAIAYDVPGCRDAIIAGKTGYLCPSQDLPALIEAISNVCQAPDQELAAMGHAARAEAEARFSDSHVVQLTVEAVLESRP